MHKLIQKVIIAVGSPASILGHSIFFIAIFSLHLLGTSFATILLLLTTIVSLEAIYLSLFLQWTVNQHSEHLEDQSEQLEDLKNKL